MTVLNIHVLAVVDEFLQCLGAAKRVCHRHFTTLTAGANIGLWMVGRKIIPSTMGDVWKGPEKERFSGVVLYAWVGTGIEKSLYDLVVARKHTPTNSRDVKRCRPMTVALIDVGSCFQQQLDSFGTATTSCANQRNVTMSIGLVNLLF